MDDAGFWDGIAGFGTMTSRVTMPFAERALAEATLAEACVLGIATGNGALALTVARAGFRVPATDFSARTVRDQPAENRRRK